MPGYYPDPLGVQDERLWDGSQWTTQVRASPAKAPATTPPAPGSDGDGLVPKRPREVGAILGSAFRLYRRYPFLFLALAAGVVVTYDLIVLATTGEGYYSEPDQSVGVQIVLGVVEWVLVGPLISALHVHAVAEIREGREPELRAVALSGLAVLPVVAAAVVMSSLGTVLGLLALIVPGVILFFRWFVVAQVAALEPGGWLEALRGSHRLTKGNYIHIFVFVVVLAVIIGIPGGIAAGILGVVDLNVATFLIGLVFHLFIASFGALSAAVFYFDLVARRNHEAESAS